MKHKAKTGVNDQAYAIDTKKAKNKELTIPIDCSTRCSLKTALELFPMETFIFIAWCEVMMSLLSGSVNLGAMDANINIAPTD